MIDPDGYIMTNAHVVAGAQRVARVAGATSEVPLYVRDVIRSINNNRVVSLYSLREALKGLPAGAPVTLQIQREGRLMYVSFTLD